MSSLRRSVLATNRIESHVSNSLFSPQTRKLSALPALLYADQARVSQTYERPFILTKVDNQSKGKPQKTPNKVPVSSYGKDKKQAGSKKPQSKNLELKSSLSNQKQSKDADLSQPLSKKVQASFVSPSRKRTLSMPPPKTRPSWDLPTQLADDLENNKKKPEYESYDPDVPSEFARLSFSALPTDKFRLEAVEVPSEAHISPPTLAHGLDRVLFNPGVHLVQDPRTRVYNFSPSLKSIMSVHEFDFDVLPPYHISSKDPVLPKVAKENNLKYFVSTSSLTSTLSQFHFLISRFRPPDIVNLTRNYDGEIEFAKATVMASSVFLRYNDETGLYAIDSDKSEDAELILTYLGRSMELQLVTAPEDYEKYRVTNSHLISQDLRRERESYHYSKSGDFLLRSQQDCMDPRLPGTGTFDLKTRAVAAVRYDIKEMNKVGKTGYQLKTLHGKFESFESEYADLIRTTLLKYSLQARIGRMDGIFLAYHNIARIFGFQYIPTEEMDTVLHGPGHKYIAQQEFEASMGIFNKFLNMITEKHPKQSMRILFHVPGVQSSRMNVHVELMSEAEIEKLQATKNSGFRLKSQDAGSQPQETKETSSVAEVSEPVQPSDVSASSTADIPNQADDEYMTQLLNELNELNDYRSRVEKQEPQKLFKGEHYIIDVRNLINGKVLKHLEPPNPTGEGQWTVEYSIRMSTDPNAATVNYHRALASRDGAGVNATKPTSHTMQLRALAAKGEAYAKEMDELERKLGSEIYSPTRLMELMVEYRKKKELLRAKD